MPRQADSADGLSDVRSQAASRLAGGPDGQRTIAYGRDALSVLCELAVSPATAGDALTLLHELQVHQIELDLQAEELRESRIELESALRRQMELYDAQPVGCFTVDRAGKVQALNRAGAAMLGVDGDKALGLFLGNFLDPGSRSVVQELITGLDDGRPQVSASLLLASAADAVRAVDVHAGRGPDGSSVLLVMAPAPSSRGS